MALIVPDETVLVLWVDQRNRLRHHKLRLQKLLQLLTRKATIEESILTSNKKVEKAFLAANQELRVTFEERSKDVVGHEHVQIEPHAT